MIDTNIVYAPIPGRQGDPSVVFDGTNYLVVWQDERGGSWGIYGARVNQLGVVLDSVGIAISADGVLPSVASGSTNYLVVWSNGDIYGTRVDHLGTILDTLKIAISTDVIYEDLSAIAFDGTNYLVVWTKYYGTWPDDYQIISGIRVSSTGVVLDSVEFIIDYGFRPSVAFGDTNYLVAWSVDIEQFYYGICCKRISKEGVVLDSFPIVLSWWGWQHFCPSVSFDGTNFLVVWEDDNEIFGKRVNQSGVVLDSVPINIPSEGFYPHPDITFDGANYLVVSNGIVGARVDTSGLVLDSVAIQIFDGGIYPSIVFGGTNYFVAWQDDYGGSDIYGARVNQEVVVLDTAGIDISTNIANCQSSPSIAFNSMNYFVVWNDYRNGEWDIYGVRVDTTGVVVDTGIPVSTAENDQLVPSVVFGDINYFAVWQDKRNDSSGDIYGARVELSGTVLDPLGIAISAATNGQASPSVAFDGTNYLIVWEDQRFGGSYPDIYGARVSQGGILLDPAGIAISTSSYHQISPSVAFDGINYLIVWADRRTWLSWDIYGARVSTSGTVIDTDIVISTAANWRNYPSVSVTFDGINYLVVWEDDRNGSDCRDIYGTRVDTSGIILDPEGIAISTAQGQQRYPVANFDGTNYLVVWQDFRSDHTWDIYGAKVSTSGEVLDTYVVSTQTGNQLAPALARGNANEILVTYSGWTDSINTHAANTMRIWGTFYSSFGVEERKNQKPKTTYGLWIYPNPCKQITDIRYQIGENQMQDTRSKKQNIFLKIYDVSGRIVKDFNVASGFLPSASVVSWDGTDDSGRKLAAGVYFVKFEVKDFKAVKKVVFLR